MDIFGYTRGGDVAVPKNEGKQMEETSIEKVLEHKGLFNAVFLCEKNGEPFYIDVLLKKGTPLLSFVLNECRERQRGANALKKMYGLKCDVKINFIRVIRGC